jgi:hypothetical protein
MNGAKRSIGTIKAEIEKAGSDDPGGSVRAVGRS